MFTVQPEGFEAISDCARRFQEDVEKLAERFSLEVDGRFPAMELHVHRACRRRWNTPFGGKREWSLSKGS
ncbi:hypothetical protein [Brevibacillus borstelensis]|uniref:hypothetical protein n=1 Tax=Brevibacillus borstelensis TaxID=45462 RepID=UPI001D13ABAF|nr:hypothetical protein [Brevibacillus borstelensis]